MTGIGEVWVDGDIEERIGRWARIASVIYPPVSAFAGLGMFMWLSFTNAGARQPEWYALVGGLIGSPVISWALANKRKGTP